MRRAQGADDSLGADRADDRTWLDAGLGPADRIIIATARVLGVPLVTSDARIIDSNLVPTIW